MCADTHALCTCAYACICACEYACAYHKETVKHTPIPAAVTPRPRARRKLTGTNTMQAIGASTGPLLLPRSRGDDPAAFLHPLCTPGMARAARLEHSLLLSARGDCLALCSQQSYLGPRGASGCSSAISSAPVGIAVQKFSRSESGQRE
jgi:hypothetical protein